ncbi:MAG: PLP-dependent transferase [Deltaproteobacteria bacterium]|nr:PLP-dependent transferase [Deltaproteobacteria bacterium]
MKGFTTKSIHIERFKPDVHGALRMPVYDSVAFEHASSKDIQLAFEGKKPSHSYSRISNPTVEEFEQKIRVLSDAFAVLAVSSGMAAISNTILTLAGANTNIVTSKHLFGNTFSLFEHTLKPWGLETRYVSMSNPDEVANAIDENTRAVFLENITNPQMEVADIAKISKITKEKKVPLIIDGTVTTPYLFKSKDFGVNIELISSTKYISGGATSVGGLIIDNGNFDWKNSPKLAEMARKRGPGALMSILKQEVYRNMGACHSAHNAYLQTLGLETMGMRIDRSCENTLGLANYLSQHAKVVGVNYPGLTDSPYHEVAKKQFGGKYGGILTMDLESKDACYCFMDELKLIKRATNINDNKTMIIHPNSTIYCEYSEEEKLGMGIRPTMLRVAVGIEDLEDLLNDFEQGLDKL